MKFLSFDCLLYHNLQIDGALNSQALLVNVENYAAYVGEAIVNENVDTGDATNIVLPRYNIGENVSTIPVPYIIVLKSVCAYIIQYAL